MKQIHFIRLPDKLNGAGALIAFGNADRGIAIRIHARKAAGPVFGLAGGATGGGFVTARYAAAIGIRGGEATGDPAFHLRERHRRVPIARTPRICNGRDREQECRHGERCQPCGD